MKLFKQLKSLFGETSSSSLENELNSIFPYIVPKSYLEIGGINIQTLIADELYVTLVKHKNDLATSLAESDLDKLGLSKGEAFDLAKINLQNALKEREINITMFHLENIPFILFSDSWLSASCLLVPEIEKLLNENMVYVSIPHRDAMVMFPVVDGNKTQEFKKMIKEREGNGIKPLTFELFEVSKSEIKVVKQ
ncbi:hypothetical protein [Mannheimia indoligenes]|uniref:hypothetical protein n=1 Tax=Mannheimia indoligenes TaxID=3103145 RepID=UPI002FE50318